MFLADKARETTNKVIKQRELDQIKDMEGFKNSPEFVQVMEGIEKDIISAANDGKTKVIYNKFSCDDSSTGFFNLSNNGKKIVVEELKEWGYLTKHNCQSNLTSLV